ncbi:hypothetical protein ACHAPJ_012689 [Fusarium lateritium]
MDQQLCDVCAKLNIEDLVCKQGFAQHKNLLDIHKFADTCQLCRWTVRVITWRHSKFEYSSDNEEYLASQQARVFYGQHIHRKHGLILVVTDVNSETPSTGGEEFDWLLIRTLAGDSAQRYGAKTARFVPVNSSSQDSTIQALRWLKECLLSKDDLDDCSHVTNDGLEQDLKDAHGLDGKLLALSLSQKPDGSPEQKRTQRLQLCEDVKFLYEKRVLSQPGEATRIERAARLVEIVEQPHEIANPTLKLKLVQGSADCTPYVALSYRWGGLEAVWQTTKTNLDSRRASFSINDLPKTLSESVQVVRDLGFKWIWIDSLCIVQDDKDDWAREAVKMASIYQNAIVTIAADYSQDAKAGLHNEKSTSMFNLEDSIRINSTLSTTEESSIFLFPNQNTRLDDSITNLRDMGDLLSHCSLRDRGWTMQERILSPRIIHYASDQIYWECYHGIQESEDKMLWMGRSVNIPKIAHRVNSAGNETEKLKELRHMLRYWYSTLIGGDYSHRALTYSDDKLVAIGGVAQALNDIEDMNYMAGHWGREDDELVKSLCWSRGGPGKKSAKYRAPSWSWASQDSAIEYKHYNFVGVMDDKIIAEPVTWQGQTQDSSAFGRYKNAFLQIKAKVAHGVVFPNCGFDFANYRSMASMMGFGGYSVDPVRERCSLLMLEGGETSEYVWLDDSPETQEPIHEPIDVRVVMLSEIRCSGEEPHPGACLICTLDNNYYLTRIGFTESAECWKEVQGKKAPPIYGQQLYDKLAIELVIL